MKIPQDIQEEHPKARKPNRARFIARGVALLLGLALVGFFVSRSDLGEIKTQLLRIGPKFFFLLVSTGIAYLLVTIAWWLSFLQSREKAPVAALFVIRCVGESLAQINPTNLIAGETLKAVLLKRRGIPYKDGIVSLTISRFLVFLSAISLILVGIYAFFDQLQFGGSVYSIYVIVGVFVALLALLLALLGNGRGIFYPVRVAAAAIGRRFKTEKVNKFIEQLEEVDAELIEFYRTKKIHFLAAYILSVGHWIMGAMEFFLILYFLGLPVSFASCIAIEVGVMVFKALGAFIPGQIGVEEYASKLMLDLVNVSGSEVWITVAILRRARQLFWICAGFIAFFVLIGRGGDLKDGNTVHNA